MKKIMVVDDEPVVCNTLKKFLTKKGYEVTTVLSGEEAIEKVKEERPCLIFLDIRMPGMDGIETLKRIKEIDKKVCVVMITAVKGDEVGRKCMEMGAFGYVTKPFSLEYLETVLTVKSFNFES